MAGRRARVNSSSDEAERSLRTTTYSKEEDVLQTVPQNVHPDDWPCFVITDAVIYSKDGKTPTSLLHAELEGPLTVRGKLEVDKDLRHLLKVNNIKRRDFEVGDVKGYSMGIGPVTVWANGKAGWFEVRPAPKYQSIFNKMIEGIELYYFLTDLYENRKTATGEKVYNVDQIFDQYAAHVGNNTTRAQVAQRCEEHAVFLCSQLRKQGEPIGWTRTSFYRWLIERCPDIHSQYTKKVDAKDSQVATPVTDTAVVSKHRRTPTLSEILNSKRVKKFHSSIDPIVQIMEELQESRELPRQRMNIRRLTTILYERFQFSSVDLAREYLKAHAARLLAALNVLEWVTSPIYQELDVILNREKRTSSDFRKIAKTHELTPRTLINDILKGDPGRESGARMDTTGKTERRPPKRPLMDEQDDSTSTLDESILVAAQRNTAKRSPPAQQVLSKQLRGAVASTSSLNSLDAEAPARIRKKPGRKPGSKNKPKLGPDMVLADLKKPKLSLKAIPSRPKSPKRGPSSGSVKTSHDISARPRTSDEEDETSNASGRFLRRRAPSRSGKVAALRLVGSQVPQSSHILLSSSDESPDGRSRKRPKVSHSPTDDSETTQSSTDLAPYLEAVDLGDDELEEVTESLTMVSAALPSTLPQGPNGLWSCPRDGCNYHVVAADKPDGRSKVHKHFLDHADEIAARENLVLEESRPYLPINHLLEKLRKLGEAARLSEEKRISGRVVPQPIKRRMVI